jgi:metal-responsive CopG/Arc/MetJ family transcriptional regulator
MSESAMRTTIELRSEQRARLLEMAARQGRKGFSHLIQEAVDRFLNEEETRQEAVEGAVRVIGTLDESAAGELRARTRALREGWR